MSTRCTGHCCRKFTLRTKQGYILTSWPKYWLSNAIDLPEECRQIYDMVIPIEDKYEGKDGWIRYFTCKNFDVTSGDCKIYEARPQMCKDLATKIECPFEGCTFKK